MTINMEKPYVVGMDIGGTNTVFGVVDSRGMCWLLILSRHSNMKTLTTMLMLYVRNFFLCCHSLVELKK